MSTTRTALVPKLIYTNKIDWLVFKIKQWTLACLKTMKRCEPCRGRLFVIDSGWRRMEKAKLKLQVISGNRVSLSFVAPSNVKILTDELNQPKSIEQLVERVIDDGLLMDCSIRLRH